MMTDKEFFELSEKEVLALNGSRKEASLEAWRAGYIYAKEQIYKMITQAEDGGDFIDQVTRFANQELSLFSFEVLDSARTDMRRKFGLLDENKSS